MSTQNKQSSRNQKKAGMTDESFFEIHNQAEKFIKNRGKNFDSSKIDTIAEEEKSDLEEKDESIEKSDGKTRKDKNRKNLEEANVEDKQVTFISQHTQGDAEEEEKSESDIVNEQTEQQDQRKKRLCYKIDKLFALLYDDLNLLFEWENDEKKRGPNEKP